MEDFEFVTLYCGHTIDPHTGAGVCDGCRKKCCGKCLQVVDDKLFCPICFVMKVGGTLQ